MNTIYEVLHAVRTVKPVVHHLTNWVTIYDCANIVKVFGASPVMAHAKEEVAAMAKIASAVVLNIGTLTPDLVEAMKIAGKSANDKGIPVVLDVCGAGATKLRDDACADIIAHVKVAVIKGNASEVARVAGLDVQTKGVDATKVAADMVATAKGLAQKKQCAVVVTGAKDIVTDGTATYVISNGHAMMVNVVGTGCMATSVIGAFAAVEKNTAFAAAAGLVCYEIAAERAASRAAGPGSFKEYLFDEVYQLNEKSIETMQKVEKQ